MQATTPLKSESFPNLSNFSETTKKNVSKRKATADPTIPQKLKRDWPKINLNSA